MKKHMILAAAAAMILGLAACTDEPIIDPSVNPEVTPMVKSTEDLVGTDWTYTMEFAPIEIEGDTIDLGLALEFGLNFDEEYAHLSFPENVTVLSMNDDYTLEEIESMNFAYTYDLATTSGTLACSEMEIPFRYDAATDAILIDMQYAFAEDEDEVGTFTLVFHRN